ncbi:MAG: hypothetical protein SGI88_18220 [Candidatus Hydrogenedentes bacterium]|nr:hypothetical protein [Candidatus Hydrogenedentota bacterium]
MLDWTRQGAAVVATISLSSGQDAKVVLVGARENPKGAIVLLMDAAVSATDTRPLESYIDQLSQAALAEILCMQERLFGPAGLPAPHFA